MRLPKWWTWVAFLLLSGCQSTAQFLDSKQNAAVEAVDTAVKRGRFEMNCPKATGTVLSQQVVQPVTYGPRLGGVHCAEYTIGALDAGSATFVLICPDGSEGCFAAEGAVRR